MIQPVITFHGGGHGVRNRFSGTRKNPRARQRLFATFRRVIIGRPISAEILASPRENALLCTVHRWNLQLLQRNRFEQLRVSEFRKFSSSIELWNIFKPLQDRR